MKNWFLLDVIVIAIVVNILLAFNVSIVACYLFAMVYGIGTLSLYLWVKPK